jgi:protein-S-isoprenylcysteine O-methyltransferase Ste14
MKDMTQDNFGVIAPPPLIYAGGLLLGLLLKKAFPIKLLPRGVSLRLGGLFILLGVLLARSGFQTLRNASTEVNPTKPTTTLVVSGPYQVTRNPLYLSLTLFYAGISLLANAFAALLLLPIVLFIINRGVIDREERYLEQKFGDEYLRYKMRVPRWF